MLTLTRTPTGWKWWVDDVYPHHLKIVVGDQSVELRPWEARDFSSVLNSLGVVDWHGGENEPQFKGERSG